MADKKNTEEFTVADRRRFSFEDGDIHENPDRSPEPVKDEITAVPAAQEPKKAEVREFPKREEPASEAPKAESLPEEAAEVAQHAPLSDTDKKAGDAAFAASSKQIDDQIRSQLGRKAEDFQMSFERFVASIYMTALMQLGLLQEQGGQPRVDLLGARQTIDTLVLLRDKTKGNVTPTEENLLNNSLYEVQMAYVEVTNALTRSVQPAPPGAVPNPFVKK
jgi:hypothetical protein